MGCGSSAPPTTTYTATKTIHVTPRSTKQDDDTTPLLVNTRSHDTVTPRPPQPDSYNTTLQLKCDSGDKSYSNNNTVQLETPRPTKTVQHTPRTPTRAKFAGNPDEFELFINDTWDRAMETLEIPKGQENPNKNLVVRRSGWKTIRIFVSSTFRDFHQEREVLVKKVR